VSVSPVIRDGERARVSMRARASLNCRVSSCLFGGGSEQARGWEGAGRMRRWKGRKARKEKKIIQTMGMKSVKGNVYDKSQQKVPVLEKSRAKPVTRSAN